MYRPHFTLEQYQQLNNSFKKKLVFRVGCEAGFFSEINNMILAIAYCLDNKIQFSFSSIKNNFNFNENKPQSGWDNFFRPFCVENTDEWHKKYNKRSYMISSKKKFKNNFYIPFLKFINNIDYLTQDIFLLCRDKNLEKKIINIPELNFHGSLIELCQNIIHIIYKFNTETQFNIDKITKEITLPDNYIGIHYRAGDKVLENCIYPEEKYISLLEEKTTIKDVFILTDDYNSILKFKEKTNWNIFTTCREDENGYNFTQLKQKDKSFQKNEIIKLLASVEILKKSHLFLGTYSANPSMFVSMCRADQGVLGLDYDKWLIW